MQLYTAPLCTLQAYLMFGDSAYLEAFVKLYASCMRYLYMVHQGGILPPDAVKGPWLGEVHIHEGKVTRPWISSLAAFWPGMQALAG